MQTVGTTSGKVCTRIVEHLDILPTLAALCGLKAVPPVLQGQSLTPLLKDSKSPWSKPAISQVPRPPGPDPIGYSIRDERYRYTSWQGATAGEELYDYDADPEEKKSIAADPSMASVKTSIEASARVCNGESRSQNGAWGNVASHCDGRQGTATRRAITLDLLPAY
jgi:iduronate 2-sulfatase